MSDRVLARIDAILRRHPDPVEADREICASLDVQETLSIALMPINSRIRTRVVQALRQNEAERKRLRKLKTVVREDELVPVEVHGGGKCKMVIYMTKEAAREHNH